MVRLIHQVARPLLPFGLIARDVWLLNHGFFGDRAPHEQQDSNKVPNLYQDPTNYRLDKRAPERAGKQICTDGECQQDYDKAAQKKQKGHRRPTRSRSRDALLGYPALGALTIITYPNGSER